MSGVEIAGFVLGGFPLLISAAEHYREGFEPLLKWKRFRTEFIGFIDAVDIEKQLYDQMLERFLLSADVPHEQLRLFMTGPNYDGWQRPDLVEVLQRRLGSSYDVYMSTIKTMTKLMAELQDVLSLKNGEVDWADDGASRWEYQMKRIRLSFRKRGPKTLAALETQNRKLRELLESNEKLESMKATRKDTTWGSIFECIRKHANNLHSALKRNWSCDCVTPHNADFWLQKRSTGGWTSNFNVAFEAQLDSVAGTAVRREFVVKFREKKGSNQNTGTYHSSSSEKSSSRTQILEVSTLRRNFEIKSPPQLNLVSRHKLRVSTSETSSAASSDSYFDKSGGFNGCENNYTHVQKGIVHVDKQTSKVWRIGRKTKVKKSVRMNLAPPVVLPLQTVSAPPSPNLDPLPALNLNDNEIEINDLCSYLRTLNAKPACHGYIVDEEQHCDELFPVQESIGAPDEITCISLETLLKGHAIAFSRQQRHKIAGILASSLLQLQTTPWLGENFGKQDILFYKKGSTIYFDHPFVRHSFVARKEDQLSAYASQATPATRFVARNSLNNLGVILLEICYGQPIEDQPIRKLHLGPDGKPHDYTNFMTARDWAESVGEQEPEWEHIIRCCISCMFEEKADWSNKKFTTAVYESVVEPLEKMAMRWSQV